MASKKEAEQMRGKRSAATERALKMVAKGVAPYRAALKCGIQPSTIYRVLAQMKKRKP